MTTNLTHEIEAQIEALHAAYVDKVNTAIALDNAERVDHLAASYDAEVIELIDAHQSVAA